MTTDQKSKKIPPPSSATVRAAIEASVGQRLLRAGRMLDETALARWRSLPNAPPIRPAHTRLFPFIGIEQGIRITEIAAELGVSKQSVAALVSDLIEWGFVDQHPDPADGRARLVQLSERGRVRVLEGLGILAELEAEVAKRTTAAKLAAFEEVLLTYLAVLESGEG